MTLWEGRLGEPAANAMALSASLSFDKRLAVDDIAASRAHVRGLTRRGIIPEDEAATLAAALDPSAKSSPRALQLQAGGRGHPHCVERRVTEMAGRCRGQAPHRRAAATTRCDRPAALPRREALSRSAPGPQAAAGAARRAEAAEDAYLPGYTHMQRAQPVLLAHHLLAQPGHRRVTWTGSWTRSPVST